MTWLRQPGEIASIIDISDGTINVPPGCSVYPCAAEQLKEPIGKAQIKASQTPVFVCLNEIRFPLSQCWVSSDQRGQDLLFWCEVQLKVSDPRKLYETTQQSQGNYVLDNEAFGTCIQSALRRIYDTHDIGDLNSPALPEAKHRIENELQQYCPGLCATEVLFQRICTPEQYRKTERRWLEHLHCLSNLYQDWQQADANHRRRFEERMQEELGALENGNLLHRDRTNEPLHRIKALVAIPDWMRPSSDRTPPPICFECGLPIKDSEQPRKCPQCESLLHGWHFPDKKSRLCHHCSFERRKWRTRAFLAGLVGLLLIVSVPVLWRLLPPPPELALKNNAYELFNENGFVGGWIPQYYMSDAGTCEEWEREDWEKAISFRFSETEGGKLALRLDFRPNMAQQGWLGVAWTLNPYDQIKQGTVAAVNLTDAGFVELKARTDDSLRVEFHALVTKEAVQFQGDSGDKAGITASLDNTWQHFRLPVDSRDLSRVVTPFCITVAANQQYRTIGQDAVAVYLRDLRWIFPRGQRTRTIYRYGSLGFLCVGGTLILLAACFMYAGNRVSTRHKEPRVWEVAPEPQGA